ncbi:TatD family hydrolase [Candidatus Saccharibacteria bacterium]|nr:TatD family hydrolase [Candidatus Saccharibacteria bacterium]
MTYLVDSHCHLHDREFFTAKQAEKMLENAHKNGVEKIICIGTSHEDSLKARDFAAQHEGVYWTYGTHPGEAGREVAIPRLGVFRSAAARDIAPAARGDGPAGRDPERGIDASLVAIGEVGLDYHYEPYDRDAQIKLFEEMLQLATDLNLPVSFHIREAFKDFFPVAANFPKIKGVVHSFSDSKKTLRKILETTDFYVGVNGLSTYSTLPVPPLERILLETDAPFLTPEPFRGTINEPAYIKNISEFIATKMGVPEAKVAEITTKNVRKLFQI